MKKSFLFSLLMGINFFVSCTTENVQLDQTAKQNSVLKQSNIVELSKLWTINNSDSLAILKGVQKIDWDNAAVSDTDKGEILEVPLILKNNLKVSYLETKNEVTNKLLFIKEASGKLNAYQMMIATKDKISSTDPSLSFSNLNSSYDGYVAFVNSSNKTVDLLPSVHRSKPSLTGREIESCTFLVEMYDDGSSRPIALLFCTYGGGTQANHGGGGGGGGGGASEAQIVIAGPANVITNLKDYLKCFNLAIGATFTIYVDQPTENSSSSWSGAPNDPDVGHTFIAIQQGDIRRVFGYYPRTNVNPVTSPSDPSAFGNDQGHTFDVAVSVPINASQLQTIINSSVNSSTSTYNLNSFNCTDFAIKMANLAGLNLQDSYGTWPGGGGSNPGQLGQNIRGMVLPPNAVRQTTSTNSAPNKGQCN
jgi:hypothetical protein